MTDIAYTVGDTAITVSYQGAQGPGVASGGTTGQVLVKSDSDDYSTEWTTLSESDIADLGVYPDATGQAADKIAQTDGADGWTFVASPAASTVTSVNSQTGAVVLSHSDVSAAAESHTHTESEITDLGSYETAGVAATLIATHHGASSTDHDDRYYTKAEVDSALSGKADTSHSHTLSDITDAGTAAASDTGDFATAAQGALADSATQPGDDADTLGSGDAPDGYVLTADGAGNSGWEAPAGGSGAVDSVNGQTGAVVLDPDDLDDTSTAHKFATAAQLSKLDGVEAGADVTDAANVTAAGALMDSEVTNLADVKAFDPTDYATAAQGVLADSALQAEEVSEVEASWDGTGDPTPGIFYGLRTLAGINPLVLSGSEVFSVSLPWATASQSSNLGANLTAERATDLLIAENTGAAHTSSGAGQWWKVDFGPTASVTVTRLGLLGRDGGGSEPRNFKLQGSDDDSTWTDLLTVTGDGPTDGSGWWSSAVTGAAGYRYLRILQTGNNADSGTHLVIGELELWGTLASTASFGRLPEPRTTRYSINHQTGTAYTLALSDDGGIVKCDNASSFSLTVPPESSVAFTAGANVKIKAHGAGTVTVVEGSGVTVNTAETLILDGQYAGAELVYEGSDVWWLTGTLVAA